MARQTRLINRSLWIAAGFAVTLAAGLASADTLYGVRSGDGSLVRIDTATLTGNLIGAVGFSSIGGLAFGNNGTLYAITTSTDVLLTVDLNTGAGTAIGAAGVPVTFSTGLGNDPITDQLYGTSTQGSGRAAGTLRGVGPLFGSETVIHR